MQQLRWELTTLLKPEDDLLIIPLLAACVAGMETTHRDGDQPLWPGSARGIQDRVKQVVRTESRMSQCFAMRTCRSTGTFVPLTRYGSLTTRQMLDDVATCWKRASCDVATLMFRTSCGEVRWCQCRMLETTTRNPNNEKDMGSAGPKNAVTPSFVEHEMVYQRLNHLRRTTGRTTARTIWLVCRRGLRLSASTRLLVI